MTTRMKHLSRMLTLLFGSFVLMVMAGCTTSKSIVSQGADLSKYKYVALIDNDTYRMPPELVQYQIQLYDAVERSGLTLTNQYRIDRLTQREQASLLIATLGVDVSKEETVITVNFIDFDTNRPMVSCRGTYSTLA